MFIAMALCLPIAWIQRHWHSMPWYQQQQQGHSSSTGNPRTSGQDVESQEAQQVSGAAAAVAKAASVTAHAASTTPAAAAAPAGAHTAVDLLTEPLLGGSHAQQQLQQHADRRGRNGSDQQMSRMKEALLLCVPTGFDLAATTLMNVGLLYVAASGERAGFIQAVHFASTQNASTSRL